ncbi:MAG TPA: tetratricopeptide repeat protein [Bacteroidota bacterium]|nr:tetratricopeptide repeat protein [Bacteroidota bacterium]
MTMRLTAVLFALAFLGTALRADEPTQLFQEGNRLYLQGKYSDAIGEYEKILQDGYESGELYFNLGNAYYKNGSIPKAILNYERAKELLPGDDDVHFNLQLANLQIVDKIDVVPRLFIYRWIDSMLSLFSLSTMGWIVYVCFLLTLVSFGYFLFARSYVQKRISMFAGMVFSAAFVLTIAGFGIQSYKESNTEFAIVMTDVANIKSAPDSRGNDLFVLHKGLKVEVLDSVNHWEKIRLADGKVGWIPEDECEII